MSVAESLRRVALGVGLILRGAGAVVVGEAKGFEVAGGRESGDEGGGFVGELGDVDGGEFLADDGALGGVVVDEDESVEADVELLRDAAQVGGLVGPVGDEAGDVLALENHLGV